MTQPLENYRRTALSRSLLTAAVVACCAPVFAQGRMQFPSQIPETTQPALPPNGALPSGAPQTLPPSTFDGRIQPIHPNWDPYANPANQQPQLMPRGGYMAQGLNAPPGYAGQMTYPGAQPNGVLIARPQRLTKLYFDYAMLAGHGYDDLGINDFNFRATFAFPFFYTQAPLEVTPGFGLHLWEGPGPRDLPPQVYDTTVDFAWRPQISPRFALDLGVRPGMFTDFDSPTGNAFRIAGRAVGILTMSPATRVVFGLAYLDRLKTKLLPVGGVLWTPNADTRFELVFPRPKLAQKLTTVGTTDWWWYVAGEYGGNTWEINTSLGQTEVDYSDLRLILGLEWAVYQGAHGMLEMGYVFDRELKFRNSVPDFHLDDTLMLRTGISF